MNRRLRILVVCTGNICRSPIAAGLFKVGAGAVGLPAQVASAGTVASGIPADPHAVAVMADRGIDISGHRSHLLRDIDVEAADLIVAMAREHVIEIVGRVPSSFSKTFSLRDLAKRGIASGPRRDGASFESWLEGLNGGRSRTEILRGSIADDIADPLGQGRRAFARTAEELEVLVWGVVDLLAGYAPNA